MCDPSAELCQSWVDEWNPGGGRFLHTGSPSTLLCVCSCSVPHVRFSTESHESICLSAVGEGFLYSHCRQLGRREGRGVSRPIGMCAGVYSPPPQCMSAPCCLSSPKKQCIFTLLPFHSPQSTSEAWFDTHSHPVTSILTNQQKLVFGLTL